MYRYYNGIRPHVVVSDLEMLKEILVKQFDVFTDREVCISVCVCVCVCEHMYVYLIQGCTSGAMMMKLAP